jgi:hypothetical protein
MMFWLPMYHPSINPHLWASNEDMEEKEERYEFIDHPSGLRIPLPTERDEKNIPDIFEMSFNGAARPPNPPHTPFEALGSLL